APSASAPLQIRTSPSARDRLSVTYVLRHGGGTGPSQDVPRSGRAQVRTGPSQDGPKSGRTQVGTGQGHSSAASWRRTVRAAANPPEGGRSARCSGQVGRGDQEPLQIHDVAADGLHEQPCDPPDPPVGQL